MHILVTGPQGCGKTTQANLIAQKLNYCLIKAGDLLREFAEQPGEENARIKADLEKGQLVDDQILARLMKDKLNQPLCHDGIVTDGYPRKMSQLEAFDPHFDKVFYIKISDDEGIRRLSSRGRSDDTPEAIKTRLNWYHQETEPVLDYYRKQGILVEIDGEKTIEEIYEDIIAHLPTKTT